MTIDFQTNILRFLLQQKEGRKYVQLLDSSCFDLSDDKVVFGLMVDYLKKFNTIPSKTNLIQLFRNEVNQSKTVVGKEVKKKIEQRIDELFVEFKEENGLLREGITEFAQRKMTRNMFENKGEEVKFGDQKFFEQVYREMAKIIKLGNAVAKEEEIRGGFLFKDFETYGFDEVEGYPTFLKGLNRMTSARGFYAPQLILLMGGPKAFKTGVLLLLALNYAIDGYNVYYADTENGKKDLRARLNQAMIECERPELREFKDTLKRVNERMKIMGGDINMGFFPAGSCSLDDVDAELEYYRDEEGWEADIIIYDYLDKFEPSDKAIKEKRLKIQNIYDHAIRLNSKWDALGFSVSPVNRKAVEKKVLNEEDFGEDFAKAYNCHATFALCRTKSEKAAGIGRLVVVVQRAGEAYNFKNTVWLKIEEKRMKVTEITQEEAEALLAEFGISDESEKPKARRNRRKDLTDD